MFAVRAQSWRFLGCKSVQEAQGSDIDDSLAYVLASKRCCSDGGDCLQSIVEPG